MAMLIEDRIQQALHDPRAPDGERITWQHPYLVFLAEHGWIPASEAAEARARSTIFITGRSVPKSTSLSPLHSRVLCIPTFPKREEFMLEFFAYATVRTA